MTRRGGTIASVVGRKANLRAFIDHGFSESDAKALIKSGYHMGDAMLSFSGESSTLVKDTFYGSGVPSGFISVATMRRHLEKGNASAREFPPPREKSIEVHSFGDAQESLQRDVSESSKYRGFWERGFFCFRGQTKEHVETRAVPNPVVSRRDGTEVLIMPSLWRRYRTDWNKRPLSPDRIPDLLWGEIVYHGIDIAALAKKNIERYGNHTTSDLEDAPDDESRAYFNRWRKFQIEGGWASDVPLVEQHYGIDTTALDLTFDLRVALFFATHRFQCDVKSGLCTYEYVGANGGQALVYVFVFATPSLTRTADLVTSIPIFEHLKPTRPIRQFCTLSHFDSHSINQAVTDIYCRLRIAGDFDPTGLAAQEELFPSRKEDLFYDALLDHPFFAKKIARYAWA